MSYITGNELSGFRSKLKRIAKKAVKAPFKIQKKLLVKPVKMTTRAIKPIAKKVVKAPFKIQKKIIKRPIKMASRSIKPVQRTTHTIKPVQRTTHIIKPTANNVIKMPIKKHNQSMFTPAPKRPSTSKSYSAQTNNSPAESYSAPENNSAPESDSTYEKGYDMSDLERPMTITEINEYMKMQDASDGTINGLSGFRDKLKKLVKKAVVVVATVKGGPVMGKKVYDKLLKSKGSSSEQAAVVQQAGDDAVNNGIPRAVGEHAAKSFFSGKNIAIGGSILLGVGLLAFLLTRRKGR